MTVLRFQQAFDEQAFRPVPQDNLSFVEQASCLLPQILANFPKLS
ncbi:MAG: hypothetical protein QQW96_01345 [Tychonema bourrellyi B0820]|nr:hypothetical protein [Tychonema bourrellyi B0820]